MAVKALGFVDFTNAATVDFLSPLSLSLSLSDYNNSAPALECRLFSTQLVDVKSVVSLVVAHRWC